MNLQKAIGDKAGLFFKVLAGEAVEATCEQCGAVEWVVPLDGPVDEIFLANYRCDECDLSLAK